MGQFNLLTLGYCIEQAIVSAVVQCTVTVAAARATIQKKGVMKALDYFNSRVQLWVSLIGALIFHESEYRGLLVYMCYIYHGSEVYMQNINLQGGSFKKYHPRAEGLRVIFF